jgi:hypothetical protein
MRSGKKKSLVGDPINFRGMANAPVNEAGVVALFSMVARDLRASGRVAPGDCSPGAPTDPYVQDSRIRFLK